MSDRRNRFPTPPARLVSVRLVSVRLVSLRRVALLVLFCLGASAAPFTIPAASAQQASFTFTGGGWGHGVGMSQYGARNMGGEGFGYRDIIAHYYPGTEIQAVAPPSGLRVHLGDIPRVTLSSPGLMSFTLGDTGLLDVAPGGSLEVSAHDGGLQIGPTWTTASAELPVLVSFPLPVHLSSTGHEYLWGKLQLTNHNGKVRVVESHLSMERYVQGIAEMPASWPTEALAAQAIAARSYANHVISERRVSGDWTSEFDISASTIDQNYEGWDARHPRWLDAAELTAGLEATWRGQSIKAYYSAANGGRTEQASYVFDLDLPYTVAGADPWDGASNPWFDWTRTYTVDEVSRWLSRASDTDIGLISEIRIGGGAGGSGRIDRSEVTLVGADRTVTINGRRMMLVLNAGIFAEGGGLSKHLPGTLTTLNGSLAGVRPSAVPAAAPAPADEPAPEPPPQSAFDREVQAIASNQPRAAVERFSLNGAGELRIAGWGWDPDAPTEPLVADVYIDGVRRIEARADEERAEVAERWPDAGAQHGFSASLTLGEGAHLICMVMREHGLESGISLGCRSVTLGVDDDGNLSVAGASSATSGDS